MSKPVNSEQHGRQRAMVRELIAGHLGPDWRTREVCIAAYERHNAEVRAGVAPDRLVEWQPGDGWEPLCRALAVPVPQPFLHRNTAAEFQAMLTSRRPRASLPAADAAGDDA